MNECSHPKKATSTPKWGDKAADIISWIIFAQITPQKLTLPFFVFLLLLDWIDIENASKQTEQPELKEKGNRKALIKPSSISGKTCHLIFFYLLLPTKLQGWKSAQWCNHDTLKTLWFMGSCRKQHWIEIQCWYQMKTQLINTWPQVDLDIFRCSYLSNMSTNREINTFIQLTLVFASFSTSGKYHKSANRSYVEPQGKKKKKDCRRKLNQFSNKEWCTSKNWQKFTNPHEYNEPECRMKWKIIYTEF